MESALTMTPPNSCANSSASADLPLAVGPQMSTAPLPVPPIAMIPVCPARFDTFLYRKARLAAKVRLGRRSQSDHVGNQAVGQLGLEPRGLRRHNLACIRHRHQVRHGGGVEGEGHRHLARVHAPLQLVQAADAAHEIDALVTPGICDAENGAEEVVL